MLGVFGFKKRTQLIRSIGPERTSARQMNYCGASDSWCVCVCVCSTLHPVTVIYSNSRWHGWTLMAGAGKLNFIFQFKLTDCVVFVCGMCPVCSRVYTLQFNELLWPDFTSHIIFMHLLN